MKLFNPIAKGRLTYSLAVVAIIYGIFGFVMKWIDLETATTIVWGGLTIFGLRRAVK